MLDCNIFPGLGHDFLKTEVNMFLLPVHEGEGEDHLTKAGCWLLWNIFTSVVLEREKGHLFIYFLIVRNIPTFFSAAWVQRTPHVLLHGLKTSQPNPRHASLSAVTHHSDGEKLVNRTFDKFFLLEKKCCCLWVTLRKKTGSEFMTLFKPKNCFINII